MYSLILLGVVVGIVYSIDNRCYQHVDVITNGCTTPFNAPAPYKDTFKPACEHHDICYGCGKTYGTARAYCDDQFKNDMKNICSKTFFLLRPACTSALYLYYKAATTGGMFYYRDYTRDICKSYNWMVGCFS